MTSLQKHSDDRFMVTPHDAIAASSRAKGADSSSRRTVRDTTAESECAWALRSALLKRDATACRELAERAGRQRDEAALPLLGSLLMLPGGFTRRLRRRQWEGARLAAVRALAQLDSAEGLPLLARAILDPSARVQEAAVAAILPYGPAALPALTSALHSLTNWPFDGMKRLVNTLCQLQTPRSAAALVPVILGGRPVAPARWDFLVSVVSKGILAVLAVETLSSLLATGDIAAAVRVLLLSLLAAGFCWMLLVLFGLLPLHASQESYERNALAMLVAEELCLTEDHKTYLPALVDGAFGYNRISPRPARKALLSLLPFVNAEDTLTMSPATRQQLMLALERSYGEEMDLALLGALEYVGTGQCAAMVAMLTQYGVSSALREEAARILPVLQARQREEQAPTTLLRASEGASAPTEQLLRPGYTTEAVASAQLLRAGGGDHEP